MPRASTVISFRERGPWKSVKEKLTSFIPEGLITPFYVRSLGISSLVPSPVLTTLNWYSISNDGHPYPCYIKVTVNALQKSVLREGNDIFLYDRKTGKSFSEDLSLHLSCYSLYAMEKRHIPFDHIKIIEVNLSLNRVNWFSITKEHVEGSKGYINGSIKDMQSLLIEVRKNIPMEEEQFSNETGSGQIYERIFPGNLMIIGPCTNKEGWNLS